MFCLIASWFSLPDHPSHNLHGNHLELFKLIRDLRDAMSLGWERVGIKWIGSFCAAGLLAISTGVSTVHGGDQLSVKWEVLSTPVTNLSSLDISPDGKWLALSGTVHPNPLQGAYQLRRLSDGALSREDANFPDPIYYARFSAAGDALVVYRDRSWLSWRRIDTGQSKRTILLYDQFVPSWAETSDSSRVAIVHATFNWGRPPSDWRLDLWTFADSNSTTAQSVEGLPGYATAMAFSPDGSLLAADLTLYNATNLSLVRDMQLEGGAHDLVGSLVFSADGEFLIGGHSSGIIRVWSVADGTLRTQIAAHTNGVWELAVALGGRVIASTDGQAVKLWSTQDGRLIRDLSEQTAGASQLAVTPDGQTLVVAWSNGRIVAFSEPFAPRLGVRILQDELVVTATGVPLQTIELQKSADLIDWTVATNFTTDQSLLTRHLPRPDGTSNQFWRLKVY